ncbi:hypothetical protein CYLTODRAFT_383512 [Cylindrobasidium torrendii FP15055 ss-10]|uniref:Regulatory P domain-containing protein n=1 Tax=Cylindrobasidium torrendii FP15055 ss-10 TaxID=1314674 RepID=A0A0D7AVT6_9AGAR|nr:hypothetical protein CYLTODRAFT_383512 [Cylindrobasidium torrendii FP15055 ss-10]
MHLQANLSTLLVFAAAALALETIRDPAVNPEYASGEVHERLMKLKNGRYNARLQAGEYKSSQYQNVTEPVACVDGYANEYKCNNLDLLYFATHEDLGSATGRGSSSWGWVKDGKEYIIIAQADGAAFAEVTSDGKLDYLGRLPNTAGSQPAIWRELRVLKDLLIVGSEAVNHHVQIFDLNKILAITESEKPKTFDSVADLESLFKELPVGRTHNIVVNPALDYAVSVGAQPRNSTFASGLVFIDLADPKNPVLAGYQAEDGYVHDAQCLLYKGPDSRYEGADVCYGYNEDTLTIYDVTDKANATIISRTSYEGAAYTHQGWLLDTENQEYLLLDDEYDEYDGTGAGEAGFPVTYIWDVKDLQKPTLTGYYQGPTQGIDHNQYIKNGWSYQSNYGNGLRILDVSSIPQDPTGKGIKELAFFDVYPEDDNDEGGGSHDFVGSWSSYGLFDSGHIVINTIERGAFVVKYTGN